MGLAETEIRQLGKPVLDLPAVVASGVQTYLDGSLRDGMVPFRIVTLDNSWTAPVGDDNGPRVKYPNRTHADGEFAFGVVMGPTSGLGRTRYSYETAYYPILAGREVQVRTMGVAPVRLDSSVSGTPVRPGDKVKASNTANYDGCGARAALASSANNLAADQHVIGISMGYGNVTGAAVLVRINLEEA